MAKLRKTLFLLALLAMFLSLAGCKRRTFRDRSYITVVEKEAGSVAGEFFVVTERERLHYSVDEWGNEVFETSEFIRKRHHVTEKAFDMYKIGDTLTFNESKGEWGRWEEEL